MPSTDYSGQEFNGIVVASSLDDSEPAQQLPTINFTSSLDDSEPGQMLPSITLNSSFSSEGNSSTTKYKMYGYCTIHNTFESWIAVGSPNPTPLPGHTILSGSVSYIVL